MTRPNEKRPETGMLPDELLWSDGNHASDVVLTALADGQHAIVPNAVHAHILACAACNAHLGNSALLSLETHRLLAGAAPERRPFPRLAVALGLAAAAIGLVPWLVEADSPVRLLSQLARRFASLMARLDTSGGTTLGVVITYVAAGCFVVAGLALARLSPLSQKKEVSR